MGGDPGPLENVSPAVLFTRTAGQLGAAARGAGLEVPAFRSPPRLEGAVRTLRQFPGGAVVSVTVRGRPFEDVAADLVEEIVRVNGLEGDAARDVPATSCSTRFKSGPTPRAYPQLGPGWRNGRRRRLKPAGPGGAWGFDSLSGHAADLRRNASLRNVEQRPLPRRLGSETSDCPVSRAGAAS